MDGHLPPLTQNTPLIGAEEGRPQTPAVSPVRRWAALAVIGTLAVAAVASLGHQTGTGTSMTAFFNNKPSADTAVETSSSSSDSTTSTSSKSKKSSSSSSSSKGSKKSSSATPSSTDSTATDDSSSCDETYTTSDKMCNSYDDIVLKGADVVAYFSLNENQTAVIGDSKFSSTYNGYTFYFSSHANKALFEASPESYAPQWGGFCAYGVSGYDGNNYLKKITQLWSVPADVNQFSIIDSKLYLFRGAGAKELFEADLDTNVEGGNGMWEGWFGDCTGFFNTECFM